MLPEYEVYALRYARHDRPRRDNFMAGSDPHDAAMPMDYFVWVIRDRSAVWLVDTGFNAAMARQRARTFLRCPIESLCALDISPEQIGHVIVTHLHYDHAGNLDLVPAASRSAMPSSAATCTTRAAMKPLINGISIALNPLRPLLAVFSIMLFTLPYWVQVYGSAGSEQGPRRAKRTATRSYSPQIASEHESQDGPFATYRTAKRSV